MRTKSSLQLIKQNSFSHCVKSLSKLKWPCLKFIYYLYTHLWILQLNLRHWLCLKSILLKEKQIIVLRHIHLLTTWLTILKFYLKNECNDFPQSFFQSVSCVTVYLEYCRLIQQNSSRSFSLNCQAWKCLLIHL